VLSIAGPIMAPICLVFKVEILSMCVTDHKPPQGLLVEKKEKKKKNHW